MMRGKPFAPCYEHNAPWARGPRGGRHGRGRRGWSFAAWQATGPGPGHGGRRGRGAGPMGAQAWAEEPLDEAQGWGPPPWARGRGLWMDEMVPEEAQQAWLEARLARLRAWKTHLEARLAETEEALAALKKDSPEEVISNQ